MSKDIHIKRGLNIPLQGESDKKITSSKSPNKFAIQPTDFYGVTPKLSVKAEGTVAIGDALFFDKNQERVKFTSPVSGTIANIKRGAKRKILAVEILADTKDTFKDFGKADVASLNRDQVKDKILISGCWPYLMQRPYDVIANPNDTPKAIFISAYNTAPLATDYAFILKDKKEAFAAGITALSKLTDGSVNLGISSKDADFFSAIADANIYQVTGKHPAGNVSFQIAKVNPINQGDKVWVVNPQDVAIIGHLFLTGHYKPERTIALAGSGVKEPQYYSLKSGQDLNDLFKNTVKKGNYRIISGDVLTGTKITKETCLPFYTNSISVIPEGDHYEFLGWHPFIGNHKLSLSRTFFSWLTPNKKYDLDTNLNGEERALVVTGEMEQVFPMDVYPLQLLKAAMANEIEKLENLGIYEVVPEDFGLIDFTNTSKLEAQEIIRYALDIMIKEVG
ncbi:MAG: Na(+)-translocating NADH-quinone reductase subunit A [Flavobacteriaceae bacterium]|nr:Na(+)-translocating NADH-quinone reductase subunit A [Flavobacteriaceae bacterium]